MLKKIISFSVHNKLITGLFVLALIIAGIYNVFHLPIDAVPDITDNQVQVITVAPALGATDIERLITFPIEQACNNIPGLKHQRSFSRFGLSVVTLVFMDDVDIYRARQHVAERLQQIQSQIPQEFGIPQMAPVTTGLGEIYQYTVRPAKGYEDRYTATDLRTIQDWIIRRQLLNVKGVAEVSSFGGLLKQYEVAIAPERLMAYGVGINEVFDALHANNQNTGGAYIEKDATALFIRSEGLAGSVEDIKKIPVKTLPNGTPLLIGQVADVRMGYATRYGAMTYNGEQQVSGAVVMMLKGANSNEVIHNIKERIANIQQMLPEGVVIDPFLDRTKMVDNSIHTVSKNLMEGALIVVFVLVLFLGNLRAGLIVASVIPLSMLFAVIMMNEFGVSGNLMSLGALDFGLIVDGAVIIVEAVMHRLSHHKLLSSTPTLTRQDMNREVTQSATRMMNSAVFGQIIILIVYLPIFALEGIEGKMFRPMAQTVAFALIGAFILSLTYVPMVSALFLSRKINHQPTFSDKVMQRLEHFYESKLKLVLNHGKTVIITALIFFAISIYVLTTLGGEFIPSLPEGDFAVETRVLPGSNLNTSIDAVSKASRLLLQHFPEVEEVVGKTGSSEVPTDPMPMDASDLMIILKDRSEWVSASTYEELEKKMSEVLEQVPGVTFGFQYPVAMRFNELISGARQDVVCKIYGEDLDMLAHYAAQLGSLCNSVSGCTGLYVESVTGMPQIVIRYKREMLAQYGLSVSDINRAVNTAFAGSSSGMVYEGEKRFDLVVRLQGDHRKNVEDVQNLLISVPGKTQVPLRMLADVNVEDGPNQIQRENSQRRITVGFNVRGRDVESTVHELQDKVKAAVRLPAGYYITYGGAFENLNEAKSRLLIAVPVSLTLIFLILYFAFGSVKQGLLIYSAIPLSTIGGILALALRGIPFSVSAGIGFIALFGVAVLNGIVLLAEFNRLRSEGIHDLKQVVLQGTNTRLRPVLMTAMVASLGFLPMAISTGEGAEVQRPLATVVIGGLLLATLLTLFVLPILYIMFSHTKKTGSTTVIVLFLLLGASSSFNTSMAQTPISLKEAIQLALKQNISLQGERLNAEGLKVLQGTAYDFSSTALNVQYGKFNSVYNDNQLGLTQTIHFPTVYARQKQIYSNQYQQGLVKVAWREQELIKQVSYSYYRLLYLQQKKSILLSADSIYAQLIQRSKERLDKGETNVLELSLAESQRGQVQQQLAQLQAEQVREQNLFNVMLNSSQKYTASVNDVKAYLTSTGDSSIVNNHPRLQLKLYDKKLADSEWSLQRARLWPDVNLGMVSTTIRGIGADNVFYDQKTRFTFGQVGIGIPLFFNAQHARTRAAFIQRQVAEKNVSAEKQLLQAEYLAAQQASLKLFEALTNYEKQVLPQSLILLNTAIQQYESGALNFIQYAGILNHRFSIQSDYADALLQYNLSVTDLNYFITSKP